MNPLTWQNPEQLFVAQDIIKVKIYSVAELRISKKVCKTVFLTHLIPKSQKMGKTYYILQKEAYSIYPQVDCLSVFQAQQISSWKIFSGIKPKLSFRLKKKAKFTDVLSSTAGPFTDFLISSKVKEIIDSSHVMQHQFFEASIKKMTKNMSTIGCTYHNQIL